jgi:hypothetical protein
MRQLTKEEAVALYDSGAWATWTDEQIAIFQLYQELLCIPWARFQNATETLLGRPVWTHEFAFPERLREEFEGKRGKPSFKEILGLFPNAQKVIVLTD